MTPVPRLLATVEPDIWTASCAPSPQPRATRSGGDSGRVFGGAGARSVVDWVTMKRLVALAAGIASTVSALPSPASAAEKFPVPDDTGLYLGAGVYEDSGRMLCGGFCFTYWEPGTLDPTGCVRLAAAEVAQFRAEDFGAEWRAERNDASGEDVQRWPRKGRIRHTAAKPASARRRTARK